MSIKFECLDCSCKKFVELVEFIDDKGSMYLAALCDDCFCDRVENDEIT